MNTILSILIGIVLGIVIARYGFQWLKKMSEKKILTNLEKGINEKGLDFLKFKKTERREEDERKQIDRESIITEFIGRKPKDEGADRGIDKGSISEGDTRNDVQRDEVQGVGDDKHIKYDSGDGKDKDRNKSDRKWINI